MLAIATIEWLLGLLVLIVFTNRYVYGFILRFVGRLTNKNHYVKNTYSHLKCFTNMTINMGNCLSLQLQWHCFNMIDLITAILNLCKFNHFVPICYHVDFNAKGARHGKMSNNVQPLGEVT